MTKNRENFNKLVTTTNSEIINEIKERNANRDWLRLSKRIATKTLIVLKEQGLTQKDLAERMNVSPQYINKLVKGNENVTLQTGRNLERILGINIYHETIKESKRANYATYISSYGQNKYENVPTHSYSKVV